MRYALLTPPFMGRIAIMGKLLQTVLFCLLVTVRSFYGAVPLPEDSDSEEDSLDDPGESVAPIDGHDESALGSYVEVSRQGRRTG